MDDTIRVGELARRTGLTVRTLHHYDELGLLTPAARTPAGHRLYGSRELRRLQAIVSLRQLGLSLDEIGGWLDAPADPLPRILAMHVARARERIAENERLVRRLEGLLSRLENGEAVSVDDLVDSVEVTIMYEKYYSPEQMEKLERRRAEVGEEAIGEVHRRWADLTERVETAMAAGVDPASADGRALGAEWKALTSETVAGFTGGDPALRDSLQTLWEENPDAGSRWGMDAEVMRWAARAVDASQG